MRILLKCLRYKTCLFFMELTYCCPLNVASVHYESFAETMLLLEKLHFKYE